MCVKDAAHGCVVFFRRQQPFQLLILICPADVSFIEGLRNTAPAHIT